MTDLLVITPLTRRRAIEQAGAPCLALERHFINLQITITITILKAVIVSTETVISSKSFQSLQPRNRRIQISEIILRPRVALLGPNSKHSNLRRLLELCVLWGVVG